MPLQTTSVFGFLLAIAAPIMAAQDTPFQFPPKLAPAALESAQINPPPSVTVAPIDTDTWRCTFRFLPAAKVKAVALAGNFNGWNPEAAPMIEASDGAWTLTIDLPNGTHFYKFVLNETQWEHDPINNERANDGHGGSNSILRLGAEAAIDKAMVARARVGDSRIANAALAHRPDMPLYMQRLANGSLLLRYRTLRGDVSGVELVLENGHTQELRPAASSERFTWWACVLQPKQVDPTVPNNRYTFIISDGELRVRHRTVFNMTNHAHQPLVRTPDWAKDAIWYQVMVDRFRNGNAANDPDQCRPWRSEWYTPSKWEGRDGQSFYEWYVFDRLYGGDLQGLTEKLDAIADLGVNALYLNPIFQAESCHKYNTTNYVHVDERYGETGDYADAEATEDLLDPTTWTWTKSDRVFLDFLREAKARGFRVILDGVFNHVGTQHPAFRDVLQHGKDSAYADWFDVTSWDPFTYEGWAGFGSLPVFKKTETGLASESAKQHIFDVTRRWMDPDGDGDPSDGIDGWRLDVPNEIALPFWVEWCAHVRSINPEAYISGEIWDRAEAWLDGKSFDAVMNYEFSKVAFDFIGEDERQITPTEADERLAELRLAYPAEVTSVLQNLIDSHDTDRAVSKLLNTGRPYDSENREQDDPNYDGNKPAAEYYEKLRLLALLQMTYVGAPMIYYGDEVGMWGSDDPNNRKPMLWDDLAPYDAPEQNHVDSALHADYKTLIALRREHEALRRGAFETVLTDDEKRVWMFTRTGAQERLLVALNVSDGEAAVALPEGAWKLLYGSGIPLAPRSGSVWHERLAP